MKISGHIVDVYHRKIFTGTIHTENTLITSIVMHDDVPDQYILPGFIDAHIHIESSMVTPHEFAKIALGHGTVATVSDPHEIANVCGVEGVEYMLDSAKDSGLKFHFGAPSCVPATSFENAGAVIDEDAVDQLLARSDIFYLSEMMNYPGVLFEDPMVIAKLNSAKKYNKPIDGHAPGLRGEDAGRYISHGISTDHECFTLEEALDKLSYGMKIIIREGSAAKNFDALHSLIGSHPDMLMFCSDDKHPDDLILGHINLLVKRALALGYDMMDVLRMACIHPVEHYHLDVGMLRLNDKADFIVVDNLQDFNVHQTYINGRLVFDNGHCSIQPKNQQLINNFNTQYVTIEDIQCPATMVNVPVIGAIDGSLITEKVYEQPQIFNDILISNNEKDILKICVKNRYNESTVAVGFIKYFGLKSCAIASTVAHDSHNIIAVGDDDNLIVQAINSVIDTQGGLSAVDSLETRVIPLPIAGLMSDKPVREIGELYENINTFVKNHGCTLHAPYMTLSFMALLVIPKIKMSDLGMFDAEKFEFY